jgi:hypothetical protein
MYYTLSIVLVAVTVAGFFMWRIHRANKKVMQILREEFDTPEIALSAPRPGKEIPAPVGETEKSREVVAHERDDAREGTLRHTSP